MIEKFLQTLIDGLSVGSLYALIALGYTMVYGILKFINFAHSDVFVLGAWVSFTAAVGVGWGGAGAASGSPVADWVWILLFVIGAAGVLTTLWERLGRGAAPEAVRARIPATSVGPTLLMVAAWVAGCAALVLLAGVFRRTPSLEFLGGGVILVMAMATCGVVGFCLERLAYKPLRNAPRLNVLITAIGVSLLLQNLGQLNWMFGTRPQPMPPLVPAVPLFEIGGAAAGATGNGTPGVKIWLVDVIGAGTAVVLMVALDWLVFRTRLGRAMRAVSYNPANASLMGIPVDRVISFTFVLGAMLAAAAGFLYSQKYSGLNQPAAATWVLLGLKAFVAAVVGGIGNIRGAMLGGLLIGLLEFFGAAYISPELRDLYVFSLLILVLLFRPSGLLGSTAAEKV